MHLSGISKKKKEEEEEEKQTEMSAIMPFLSKTCDSIQTKPEAKQHIQN